MAETKGVANDLRHRRQRDFEQEVIRQLEQRLRFAPLTSRQAAETARARGIHAVVIDYNQPGTLRAAFQGCDACSSWGRTR